MTREEAINVLYGIRADNLNLADAYTKDKYDALTSAIKALKQEPCEDAISRQAVLDLIEHYNSDGLGSVFYGYEHGVKFSNAVNKLPPVTSQPKTGWIPVETALPEGLMVNTLVSCEDDNGLPVRTMVALYDAFSKTWDCEYKVIAWMPLPEPYKADGGEE